MSVAVHRVSSRQLRLLGDVPSSKCLQHSTSAGPSSCLALRCTYPCRSRILITFCHDMSHTRYPPIRRILPLHTWTVRYCTGNSSNCISDAHAHLIFGCPENSNMDPRLAADELFVLYSFASKAKHESTSANQVAVIKTTLLDPAEVPAAVKAELEKLENKLKAALKPEEPEDPATFIKVIDLLDSHNIKYGRLTHAPTKTSEESASVRGVTLASGAKAMLLKATKDLSHGSPYVLAVMSAEAQMDWKKLAKVLNVPKASMAPLDEVKALTHCVPGAVPPFGQLFPGVKTLVDRSLIEQGPTINFNAGLRTESVLHLAVEDYMKVEGPEAAEFTTSRSAAK